MKVQGSLYDHEMGVRPPLARDSGDREYSCTCMKTTTKSGQARRGLDGAQRDMTRNSCGWLNLGMQEKKDRRKWRSIAGRVFVRLLWARPAHMA